MTQVMTWQTVNDCYTFRSMTHLGAEYLTLPKFNVSPVVGHPGYIRFSGVKESDLGLVAKAAEWYGEENAIHVLVDCVEDFHRDPEFALAS